MTPVTLQEGECQYYASPILVKNNRYYATLSNLRLIIDGAATREFKVSAIQGAFPELIEGKEPGLKLIIATPSGQKDMIWSFPLEDQFKAGEQQAWIDAINNAVGEKPFASGTFTATATESTMKISDPLHEPPAPEPEVQPVPAEQSETQPIEFIRGENVAISTAGVRVKHTFYTAYLTNLRLILQNSLGKIGREFAIAELVDAASLEGNSGEPEIAISVGMQGGLKQMIVVFPTQSSRDAWMQQLQNRLARKTTPEQAPSPATATRVGTFVPATNERVIVTTPGVHIKNRPVIVHLTNTRFVVDSVNGIVGDFAVTTIIRAIRMASELGEPGISLKLGSANGEREMHLIFPSMNDREGWMDALMNMIPEETALTPQPASPYTITTVTPKTQTNTQTMICPACGATNPVSESRCALCGAQLHAPKYSDEEDESEWPPKSAKKKSRPKKSREDRDESWPPRHSRERPAGKPYTGGVIGFISRPRDAFEYYAHETPSGPLPTFVVTGAIWALLTSIFIVYILPNIFEFDPAEFPVFSALADNILLMIIVAVILWIVWMLALLVHAAVTSVIAHLFEPSVRMSEVIAITMRCSLTFAIVGWIPIIGMFAASIWTTIETIYGLRMTQDTSGFAAVISAFLGMIVVYVLLFFIGGGFS